MIRPIIPLPEVFESLVLNINHSWDLCFWLANRFWDSVLYVLTTDTWTDKHITLPQNKLFKELIPGERWASKQLSRFHLSIPSATLYQRSQGSQFMIRNFPGISCWIRDPPGAGCLSSCGGIRRTGIFCNGWSPSIPISPQFFSFLLLSVSFTPSLAAWKTFFSWWATRIGHSSVCLASGPAEQGAPGQGLYGLYHFPGTSSYTLSLSLLCSQLMVHSYSVQWFVPSLGTSQEQGTCAFLISRSTKPIPWATLNKGLDNWADIPIAPNQSQPRPALPCRFLCIELSHPPATGESCDFSSALQAVVWIIYFLP